MRTRATAIALLLAVGGGLTAAPAAASAIPCDPTCEAQWALQRQNALPRTQFYDPPRPLRWAPAGTLIRREVTSDYRVDGADVTASRILYHSRSSAGHDVAASGVVLAPPGTPPPAAGRWWSTRTARAGTPSTARRR